MTVESPLVLLNSLSPGDTFIWNDNTVWMVFDRPPDTAGNVPMVKLSDGTSTEAAGASIAVIKAAYQAVRA